jgi:hypothetical protein
MEEVLGAVMEELEDDGDSSERVGDDEGDTAAY